MNATLPPPLGPGLARLVLAALVLLGGAACPENGGDADADADADDDDDAPPADGGPLRIVSWNLENFPADSTTADSVETILAMIEADVVGVEEIKDAGAFVAMLQALPDHDGTYATEPGMDTTVGLIIRSERVRIVEEEVLFASNSWAFPRSPLMARLEALGPDGNVEFDLIVVVVHLKAQLDAESQTRRRQACELLDEWVTAQLESDDEHDVVLMGDWNDEVTDTGANNIFQVFLDKPDQYTILTLAAAESGNFTYIPFQSFLDHVIVTADALDEYGDDGTIEVLELERTVPRYRESVSDHRPVLATFALP